MLGMLVSTWAVFAPLGEAMGFGLGVHIGLLTSWGEISRWNRKPTWSAPETLWSVAYGVV